MTIARLQSSDMPRVRPVLPPADDRLSISVVGLGDAGIAAMVGLAHRGFRVLGVDISADKVASIKAGRSLIVEPRLDKMLCTFAASGRIDATQNLIAAVLETDVTLLSMATPRAADGSCDLTGVRQASRAIGMALGMKDGFHVVVLSCVVPPGTAFDVVGPEIEKASGRKLGVDFGVCVDPASWRDGEAIDDVLAQPTTALSASDTRSKAIAWRILGRGDVQN